MADIDNTFPEAELAYRDIHEPDWLLQHIVGIANRVAAGPDVTLQIGGHFITGSIIGAKEYVEKLAIQLGSSNFKDHSGQIDAEDEQELANQYAKLLLVPLEAKYLPQGDKETSSVQEDDDTTIAFIHLKNIAIGNAIGSLREVNDIVWRGRLSAITGFYFGRTTAQ
ncbi:MULTISPECIES: hypothetical protein [Asticcacaulis]|uniref:hypothetical protein n=1 Tax=Asticcacaulis TaxID=76890 RepID=UPI001AE5C358|nr:MULTISPECIES: hypothetical protein [Asticcacaulis]MBP2159451.1 hypothetical protein [Asticcacaulis solisilvae]MDR6800722.1 hypothetical protein [Asticcacaulis sp. BE141]